jgi:membrane-bound lytic murein transglycosylase B
MSKLLLSFLVLFVYSHGKEYTNCSFKKEYKKYLCKELIKKEVTYNYANNFLLQWRKNKDKERVIDLISQKKIKYHNKREKQANNNLVKYISQAKRHLKKYKNLYDYIEKEYKVSREIITAILLKETRIGEYKPKYDVYDSLITIANKVSKKDKNKRTKREIWLYNLAFKNLVFLGTFCYKNNISIEQCHFPSSYIGAIGIPQFMPMNLKYVKKYIKENEYPDISEMEDAIVSTANFFNKNIKLKELVNWKQIGNMRKIEKEWYKYNFKTKKATFSINNKKYNCFSCNKKENKYLNEIVKKIMKYNNSSNYAVGVLRIAYDLKEVR